MTQVLIYVMLGLFAGTVSGLVGIGGGTVITPALVLWCGFSQHKAQGTTLAILVIPVCLFAALEYYRNDFVDLKAAGLICAGFALGGYIGARFATNMPATLLEKSFGCFLITIGLKMLFFPK